MSPKTIEGKYMRRSQVFSSFATRIFIAVVRNGCGSSPDPENFVYYPGVVDVILLQTIEK